MAAVRRARHIEAAVFAVAAGFFLLIEIAVAQTADVQVRAEVLNTNTYATQTRTVRIRITASNLGPDSIPALDVRMRTNVARANFIEPVVVAPCVAPQSPVEPVLLVWTMGPLASGDQRTCDVEFQAQPTAQSMLFFFSAEVLAGGYFDPLLGNERAFIDFLSVSPIDIVQDMVLTIRSPSRFLRPQPNLVNADFELSNRGPDSLLPGRRHLLRSEVYRFAGGGAESFLLFSTGDPDCELFNDDVGNSRIDQINFTNPIPPGTSQTCTLAVAARPNATGSRTLRWDVGRLTPGLLETNPADNTAFLVMQFSPAVIPVDARWALLWLIAGLAAFGAWRLRRAAG